MIYANIPQNIPQEQRAEINRSILASLKTSAKKLPAETVYNSYTGLGGLHGLDREDFDSYNDYARAKKEFEMGQFFTPHDLCARMVALASPDPSEMVLDMCCGIGNFMNHLPNLYNAYGFDVDPDAVTVARYLYPQAHIEECDLRALRSRLSLRPAARAIRPTTSISTVVCRNSISAGKPAIC